MKHFIKWTAILFSANVVSTIIHTMSRDTTSPLWEHLLFDFMLAAGLAFFLMKLKLLPQTPQEKA